jgi:hypothetical protein
MGIARAVRNKEMSLMAGWISLNSMKGKASGSAIPEVWEAVKTIDGLATLEEQLDFAIGVIITGMRPDMHWVFMATLGRVVELDDPDAYVEAFLDMFVEWYDDLMQIEECRCLCELISTF